MLILLYTAQYDGLLIKQLLCTLYQILCLVMNELVLTSVELRVVEEMNLRSHAHHWLGATLEVGRGYCGRKRRAAGVWHSV